jgi:hypothetical protein
MQNLVYFKDMKAEAGGLLWGKGAIYGKGGKRGYEGEYDQNT